MICEKSEACPVFNDKMPMHTGLGALYSREYCEGDKESCARYMVATQLGKEFVPADMLPNMVDQANEILAEHS